MIRVVAHHILSPLGDSTAANLQAVRNGATAIRQWNGRWQLPQPFMASLFSESQMAQWPCGESHTPYEAMAIASVSKAIAMWRQQAGPAMPRLDDGRTVLVLSTTKGNIGLLDQLTDERQTTDPQLLQRLSLGHSAEVIAKAVGIPTMPIVVDNACISGASAIVFATRLLRMGRYDHAVVCGAERQSRFIVSGFQSLKALSSQVCRPFDIDRTGLNLGEAAATVILSRTAPESGWHVVAGAVRNDAHHVDGLCIQTLVDRYHDTNTHQGRDNLSNADVHHRSQLANGNEFSKLQSLAVLLLLTSLILQFLLNSLTLLLTVFSALLVLALAGQTSKSLLYLACYSLVVNFYLTLVVLTAALVILLFLFFLFLLFLFY